MNDRCASCGAPRLPMAYCPQCNTPYPTPAPAPGGTRWTHAEEESRLEQRLRRFAPPAALLLALLVMQSDGLRGFLRMFDSMWLHELGHAASAWLSGFAAFPGPWRTSISETRSPLLVIVIALVLAGGGAWAWREGRRRLAAVAWLVLALQMVLTVMVPRTRAQGLILFFGDGGAMVLGAVLVASFWSRREGYLHKSWLRWGFLGLGAFGFMDPFTIWWRARHDPDVIPYGDIEGVGHSDPTRLVDDFGWSQSQMVGRFVAVGVVCLVGIAIAGLADWRRERQSARD